MTRPSKATPNQTASRKIRDAVDQAGEARDQKALMITLTALRDIADRTGSVSPPDSALTSKETFREFFVPRLQKCARDALAAVDALSGNPFQRIEDASK